MSVSENYDLDYKKDKVKKYYEYLKEKHKIQGNLVIEGGSVFLNLGVSVAYWPGSKNVSLHENLLRENSLKECLWTIAHEVGHAIQDQYKTLDKEEKYFSKEITIKLLISFMVFVLTMYSILFPINFIIKTCILVVGYHFAAKNIFQALSKQEKIMEIDADLFANIETGCGIFWKEKGNNKNIKWINRLGDFLSELIIPHGTETHPTVNERYLSARKFTENPIIKNFL